MELAFLLPVYNDKQSLLKLISEIKKIFDHNFSFKFIIINDGSRENFSELLKIKDIILVNLRRNIGNQKSIYVGISYIYNKNLNFNYLIIMDSDGEDDPFHIPTLIETAKIHNNEKIIFASRLKRNEKLLYIIFYLIYKIIFTLLSGKKINFGNYSCLSKNIFSSIANIPFLDKHYASAIIASGVSYASVLCDKGKRYHGSSSMNFVNFVLHAAKSFSVFYEKIIARLLIFSFFGIATSVLLIITIFINKFTATFVLIGWTSSIILGLSIIGLFFLFIFFACLFLIINKSNFYDNSHFQSNKEIDIIESVNQSE